MVPVQLFGIFCQKNTNLIDKVLIPDFAVE